MLASLPDSLSPVPVRRWCARLWLPGAALAGRERDEQARLWLLLDDGRVLVFRLAHAAPDDAFLDAVASVVIDDARGDTLEIALDTPTRATFLVLYGAPASPVGCVEESVPAFGAALAFHASLDGEALAALADMAGPNTFWASARNYNRLAAHARRQERLQALTRFPFLVAPILLSRQRWPNLSDAKRYRWRAHDAAVVEAIEQGRDLVGALATCYGISRGLVRSPFCAAPWVASTGLPLAGFLQFVDAIPPNRRPQSVAEVDAYSSHLPALWGLFGTHRQFGARAFRAGYAGVWESLERRFPALNESIVDTVDYLQVLVRWLVAKHRWQIDFCRLAALWAGERGLASLLLASTRWHEFRQQRSGGCDDPGFPGAVPAIVGQWREGAWQASELATRERLVEEGLVMRHCVADYWEGCVRRASRVFALESGPGGGEGEACSDRRERATALFEDEAGGALPRYRLTQLRGPRNAPASKAMHAFARRVAHELNAPSYAGRRALASRGIKIKLNRQAPPELDEASIQVLAALLALPPWPVAGEDGGMPANRLRAPVAGYAYACDPAREAFFATGQPLALIREPENPHDSQAIRIEWRGEKVGYVPRPDNAELAAQIDAGATFAARIGDFVAQAPLWQRLWFEIVLDGGERP